MISVNNSHLYLSAKSHPGMSGKDNEDRYAVSAYQLGKTDTTPVVFAIVSDGIGGHQAGERAAEIAVETISEDVAHSDGSHPVLTMQEAIIHASNLILSESETDGDKKGMGATCACVWIIGDQLFTASVGDSRIYLIREGLIRQLTTDHTWVQEAISAGLITPEEGRTHLNAHVIRRYLGSRQIVEPDTRLRLDAGENDDQSEANQGLRLRPKDQLLLCSDGLTDLVDDDEIQKALQGTTLDNAIVSLVDLANRRGGHDNITIVALGVPDLVSQTKPLPAPIKPSRKKRRMRRSCLILVFFILLLGTIILAGLYAYSRYWQPTASPTVAATLEASPAVTTSPEITGEIKTPNPTP